MSPVGGDSDLETKAEGSESGSGSGSADSSNNGSDAEGKGSGASSSSPSSSEDEGDSGSEKGNDKEGSEDEGSERSRSRSRSRSSDGSKSRSASSGSSRSRSRSRSGSRSGSGSHSDSDSSSRRSDGSKSSPLKGKDKDKVWEENPELYGVRRSHRPRVEPKKEDRLDERGHKRKGGEKRAGKVKRRKVSSDQEDDSDDEGSSRTARKRVGKEVSYKEAESEDEDDLISGYEDEDEDAQENGEPEEHVETIERIIESRIGKKGATGSGTTIYTVEEKGDPNETLPEDTEKEKERQFLIKWAGWSYLHNTWESLQTLQEMKVKGFKKLDNFCKKEDDHARWKSRACIEDIEYVECQLELQQELTKSYIVAERVIAEKTNAEGAKEYYVKWESLPYAEATWENAELIKKRSPESIKEFKRREASNRTPSTSAKFSRVRPKFVTIKSQPDYLKGESKELTLRDYQLNGLNWLVHSWCKENSVILADEMGLGKTIQTICFLAYLFENYSLHGPFLLVVPLSTMAAWQREFAQWAPQINVVTYLGDIPSRAIIQDYEWYFKGTHKLKLNAVLTTYEIVLKDKDFLNGVSWAALMVDEAHRLKNQDSLLYKALMDFDSNHRLLITGTPLQNSLKELWSLLHFIMPSKFDDWEDFEKEHDISAHKSYHRLHKQLEPYILRRVKKDVEKSLPAKVEQILRVEMTTMQKQFYKWILTKNYTALRKGVKGSVSSFVNVVMELKKCCNHATLIKPLEAAVGDSLTQLIKGSGKLMLLDKLLVRLKDTGHRVLIFSQMVMMLDIIAEYLQLRRFPFQRLDGSIKGDMRKQAMDHFNAEGSQDFCFLLSTRAGGLGINLATADTVIIFDSDWNPQNDLQAQARAHRIGQKNQVMIYRLVTKNSVEEDIVERAKRKMVLDHLVIQRMDTTGRTVLDKGSKSGTPFNKDELNAILKFGAEELFKEDADNEGDDNCDIDEILRRAETHEEAARPGDELLSAFKVASFSMNEEDLPAETTNSNNTGSELNKEWDDIIPEDVRKQVEADEKEKAMQDLFLPPRSSRATTTDSKGQPLGNEALNRKYKSRKRKRATGMDLDDKEESESDSDEDAGPKKRGRPKHGVKGYTDVQIRKFLKSLKRFPAPLQRIDKIAQDSGLIDRSQSDLRKLAEQLLKGCEEAMAEQKANPQPAVKDEPAPTPSESEATMTGLPDGGAGGTAKKKPQKPREKGPIFKVCGVGVNARTLSIAVDELQALGEVVPLDSDKRKDWKLDIHTKNSGFDVEWGVEEDSRLLLGVWEHGMGSWEQIREADPVLKEKIFMEGDKKPLIKHVSTRADYLLRALKKHLNVMKVKQGKIKKKRGPKGKNKDGDSTSLNAELANSNDGLVENGKLKGSKGKGSRKKKDNGPMHFTAKTEPLPVAVLGEMDPIVFTECKEKMRPVKKALKSLDNCDTTLPEKEQIQQTKSCLLAIGQRIEDCLKEYPDHAECKKWKSYLWFFVSQFTEYDASALHRIYRKAVKRAKEKSDHKHKKKDKDRDKEKMKEKDKDRDREKVKEKDKDRDREKVREKDKDRDREKDRKERKKSKKDKKEKDEVPRRIAPPPPPYDYDRDRRAPYYRTCDYYNYDNNARLLNNHN